MKQQGGKRTGRREGGRDRGRPEQSRERKRRTQEDRRGSSGAQESLRDFYPGNPGFEEHAGPQYGGSGSGGSTYGSSGYGAYGGEGQAGGHGGEPAWAPDRYGPGQYGDDQYARDPYQPHYEPERRGQGERWRDPYGNRAGRESRSEQRGRTPQRGYEDWRRQGSYGGYGTSGDYGYGSQSSRGPAEFDPERYRYERSPFMRRTADPRPFGTGAYATGGPGFGGGYGEDRFGTSMGGYEPGPGAFGTGYSTYGGPQREPGTYQRRGPWGWRSGMARRGPKGYQRSDERLKEDISERLMEADHIDPSEVSVDVQGGKVTLEGTVPERYMKHEIEDLADACPGVQDIDNRIRVVRRDAPSRR